MSLGILFNLIDKQLIIAFIYSLLHIIYYKFLIFLILNINDDSLYFVNRIIKLEEKIEFYDSDDSDDSDQLSELSNPDINSNLDKKYSNNINNILEEYNKYLTLCEYEIILKIFNINNNLINVLNNQEKEKIPIIYNKDISFNNSNNDFNNAYIVDSFLFNITLHKNKIFENNIDDIYNLKNKIILLYYLQNKFTSNSINNIFPNYKYLYILYKKEDLNYECILIDLHNNFDIINNKKLLFNSIYL